MAPQAGYLPSSRALLRPLTVAPSLGPLANDSRGARSAGSLLPAPILLQRFTAAHGRVLRLEPIRRAAGPIARVPALRDTMPSSPILQACANTVGPSASIWFAPQVVAVHLDQIEGVQEERGGDSGCGSKLGTPSSPQHTASPSMMQVRARSRASASTIGGKPIGQVIGHTGVAVETGRARTAAQRARAFMQSRALSFASVPAAAG